MAKHLALITGASQGIGKDLAECAAKNGADVILVARSKEKLLDLAKDLTQKYKVSAHVIPSDLSHVDAAEALYAATQRAGLKPDIVINNAGFGALGPFHQDDLQRLDEMIRLNCLTLMKITRLYSPRMVEEKWGRILNVASTAAFQPCPNFAVYGATKAFVLSLSEAVNAELSGSGVKVCTLCPGPTETGFHSVAGTSEVSLMKLGLMKSEAVARIGYAGMMRGKSVIVPGFLNLISSILSQILPRSWIIMTSKFLMTRT
ncbi:MAG: SDR family oxidoreductase [Oligoflexia bacterium]|nr:SDR family oxidoreductase [Oligoflexia bacterium]